MRNGVGLVSPAIEDRAVPDRSRLASARELTMVWIWGLVVAAGFGVFAAYEARPGPQSAAPSTWPEVAGLERGSGTATLVMAVHPRCPCTRASLEALARLLAGRSVAPETLLLVFTPEPAPEGWLAGPTWAAAAALPGVRLVTDPGGRLAERLGARTSGHVVLYGPDGGLRFQGGITPARARVGENTGGRILAAILDGSDPTPGSARVFGCPIQDPSPDRGGAGWWTW